MQTIERVGERFWYQTPVSETDRPILGMVAGSERTLMIDAGNSGAHAQYFLEELAARGVPAPGFVVLTHWHWDHIFGLAALREGTVSIASALTKEEMAKLVPFSWSDEAIDRRVEEGIEIEFCAAAIKKEFAEDRDIEIALPVCTFENRMTVDLGGVTCILQHVGGDHAGDSVVVYIPEERILFLGDCIYPDIYAKRRQYTPENILALAAVLESFEADTYVLSHWKPVSRAEFREEMALLKAMARLTESFGSDAAGMRAAYEKEKGRALLEEELETLEYFVNGCILARERQERER
ncbi:MULTISPECIES: MBL fold metallo-hydrolase [Paenibacillus]|uniref:MBL fold metallo-hydrolase n=1 Tax=Paenibacillus TaxID=44249 RepID=UPI0022B900C8|nr:MBL fold metallo-hydrolase [Paenibacillus caseinilyticus]MCZ8518536.1 MBL fold metallo-hydrolase [Paenibacillus caseinilyticus]